MREKTPAKIVGIPSRVGIGSSSLVNSPSNIHFPSPTSPRRHSLAPDYKYLYLGGYVLPGYTYMTNRQMVGIRQLFLGLTMMAGLMGMTRSLGWRAAAWTASSSPLSKPSLNTAESNPSFATQEPAARSVNPQTLSSHFQVIVGGSIGGGIGLLLLGIGLSLALLRRKTQRTRAPSTHSSLVIIHPNG